MDSFAIDLDKVLDDFEESEDVNISKSPILCKESPSVQQEYHLPVASRPAHEDAVSEETFKLISEEPSIYDQGSGFFDLSEANFGPTLLEKNDDKSLPPSYNGNNHAITENALGYRKGSQEGYFVPEGLKSEVYDDTSGLPNGSNKTSDSYDYTDGLADHSYERDNILSNNQPEILQAASELQAHLSDREDRPSFMSSSPPTGGSFNPRGTPDIIPTSSINSAESTQNKPINNLQQSNIEKPEMNQYHSISSQSDCESSELSSEGKNINYNPISDFHRNGVREEKNNFNPLLHRNDHVMISSGESSSNGSGVGYIDQQYSILSSMPDIAKDELVPSSESSSSPEIVTSHTIKHVTPQQPLNTETTSGDFSESSAMQSSVDPNLTAVSVPSSRSVIPDVTLSCLVSEESIAVKEITNKTESSSDGAMDDTSSAVLPEANFVHSDIISDAVLKDRINRAYDFDISSNTNSYSVNKIQSESTLTDNSKINIVSGMVNSKEEPSRMKETSSNSKLEGFANRTIDCENYINDTCESDLTDVSQEMVGNLNNDPQTQKVSNEISIKENNERSINNGETSLSNDLLRDNGIVEIVTTNRAECLNVQDMQIPVTDVAIIDNKAAIDAKTEVGSEITTLDNILDESVDINLAAAEAQNDLDLLEQEIHKENINTMNNEGTTSQNQPTTEINKAASSESYGVTLDNLEAPVDSNLNKRRGSGGSVERFLVPSVMSPGIATPMEDAGYTKIPGFTPALASMAEGVLKLENPQDASVKLEETGCVNNQEETSSSSAAATTGDNASGAAIETTASGARPKDISSGGSLDKQKRNRPNSLLGLSTPDLSGAQMVQSDGSVTPSNNVNVQASEMNPLYVAAMQRPGIAPNRVVGNASGNMGRPSALAIQPSADMSNRPPSLTGDIPNARPTLALGDPTHQHRSSIPPELPQQQQQQHPGQYTPVATVQKTPETPPPAYTAHPQMPAYRFPPPPHQAPNVRGVPPSSLHLVRPMSQQQVPGTAQMQGPNMMQNVHTPLHRVSQGQAYHPGVSLQPQLRPNTLNVTTSSVSPIQQYGGMNLSPMTQGRMVGGIMPPPAAVAVDSETDNSGSGSVDSASEAIEAGSVQQQHQRHGLLDSLEAPPGLTPSPGHTPGMMLPPPSSSNPSVSITDLGKFSPAWLPDAEAPTCMQCDVRFTFTKRRHHCRACGKVYCSTCCNLKSKLQYLESKEARVCSKCYQDLIRAQVFERMGTTTSPNPGESNYQPQQLNQHLQQTDSMPQQQQQQQLQQQQQQPSQLGVNQQQSPNPNNPSSLKRESSKQVMFSDGVRPGGHLAELDGSSSSQSSSQSQRSGRKSRKTSSSAGTKTKSGIAEISHFLPESGLPPIFICNGDNGDIVKEENPSIESTMKQLSGDDTSSPVPFVVNKNLIVLVKIVNLDCCLNKKCICFTSKGLCTIGQCEVVILLECLQNENTIPLDIFKHYQYLYEQASKGNTVSNMDHSIFTQKTHFNSCTNSSEENGQVAGSSNGSRVGFLGSNDHGGFLYINPSFQCLMKLVLPEQPYLVAVLLQKWEIPWAKVFPLRLQLRLGAEFRYYPCPLVSVRHRKPVYGEIGHTIMNLLVDFRNYQYSIPQVRGFTIHMKDKKTYLNFPRNRYQDVVRVLSNGNEHVIAVGAAFSHDADSYLVCIQNDEGNYQTQAINIQNKPRKVTGATFVVFNGALKSSSNGMMGKSSIVEDGLMIQVLPEVMLSIRDSLKDMRDLTIKCGVVIGGGSNGTNSGGGNNINGTNTSNGDGKPEEEIIVRWVDDDKNFNVGVKSPVDGFALDGVECIHVHNTGDYPGPCKKAIRWVEVFFLQTNEESSRLEPVDLSRLAETLSTSTCVALAPQLDKLSEAGLLKIGLRATIDNETVGYEVGSNGEKLPDMYMNSLDNELIPVIHNAASQNRGSSVTLELVFYVINT